MSSIKTVALSSKVEAVQEPQIGESDVEVFSESSFEQAQDLAGMKLIGLQLMIFLYYWLIC